MLRVKERVGVLPGVELEGELMYPSGDVGGVVRIDMDVDSSGTVRVVPSIVESCLEPPLRLGDALPAYRPAEIEFEGKRYILKEPLACDVHWDVEGGDFLWIEYAPFAIYAAGPTLAEAVNWFVLKFACNYERYQELSDPGNSSGIRLSARLESIRVRMNECIKSVITL